MDHGALVLIEIGALILGIGLLSRLAAWMGISPIPLILLGGLAFGEGGLIPFSAGEEFIEIGAEIGVILLLLMLGLEYTAQELVGNLKGSRTAGLIDMALNAAPGVLIALLLGWGPVAAVAMGGITWVSSSGVIAKVLQDLGRLTNRETPVVLSILVIEDFAMAFYLPVLTALLIGTSLIMGTVSVVIALLSVLLILYIALRHGKLVSRLIWSKEADVLLLSVLGLGLLVSGLAAGANVSSAVGAFLVGIAISGPAAKHAQRVLTPLRDLFAAVFFLFVGLSTDTTELAPMLVPAILLAIVGMSTKLLTGYLAARRAGIAEAGRWRAGFALMPRGEFSIVIAGLAVAYAAVPNELAALSTAYVLLMAVLGPIAARVVEPVVRWQPFPRRERVTSAS